MRRGLLRGGGTTPLNRSRPLWGLRLLWVPFLKVHIVAFWTFRSKKRRAQACLSCPKVKGAQRAITKWAPGAHFPAWQLAATLSICPRAYASF